MEPEIYNGVPKPYQDLQMEEIKELLKSLKIRATSGWTDKFELGLATAYKGVIEDLEKILK